jgi:radical SAM protein with 4Fe4S-binding SPASM domain
MPLLPECGIYTVVEHNGDVLRSAIFCRNRSGKLGNIMNDKLTDCSTRLRKTSSGAQKAVLPPECGECPWLTHC